MKRSTIKKNQPVILVAPNSYKECATSAVAAGLIASGLTDNGMRNVVLFPVSDGGDGFLSVCEQHFNIRRFNIKSWNCSNGKSMVVPIGVDNKTKTAFIEVASVVGLKTISSEKRNPMVLTTQNLGEILRKLNKGWKSSGQQIRKVVIGIGGTGTNDLGLGLCKVFGLRFMDKSGNELEVIPKNYRSVSKIILPDKIDLKAEVVLDVKIPLTGEKGPARIFAGQKGASKSDILKLEVGAKNIIDILLNDHGIDIRNELYGAGGGITIGLSLVSQVNVVHSQTFLKNKLKLESQINKSDVVITGEGKFDAQSFMNKATGVVLQMALDKRKKVYLLTGEYDYSKKFRHQNNITVHELQSLFKSKTDSIRFFRKGIYTFSKLVGNEIQGIKNISSQSNIKK